jgi:hypothetical protein
VCDTTAKGKGAQSFPGARQRPAQAGRLRERPTGTAMKRDFAPRLRSAANEGGKICVEPIQTTQIGRENKKILE